MKSTITAPTTRTERLPGQQGSAMKRLVMIYFAGTLSTVALAVYAGGERVTQLGLKLSAAEARYEWSASPIGTVAEAATVPPKGRRR